MAPESSNYLQRLVNTVNLSGWLFLQIHVGIKIVLDHQQFTEADLTLDINILRIVQLLQLFDIILIVIGKSKGSLAGAFFQILGRLIVALLFVEYDSEKLRVALVMMIWSLADVNRYLYYLFKKNNIIGLLRYHSFLVLYPLGVYAEMMVVNDYVKRHAETLTDMHINLIRIVQIGIVVGLLFLYNYMLKMRGKFMKNFKSGVEEPQKRAEVKTELKSPRAKRD